jgi:serine/threonine-protein kinase
MSLVGNPGADRVAQPVASSRSALAGWSAAGLLAVALAVVAWPRTDLPTVAGNLPAVRFKIDRSAPNIAANSPTAFALSPDGQFLAHYGVGAGGRILLSIRTLVTGETREVPDSLAHNQMAPFWSMDSRYVVYPTTRAVQVFDVATSTVRDLCACRFQGGSWNRSGVILLGAWRPGDPIQRLSLEDRTLRPVTTVDPATGARDQWPVFLPDGQRFLFTRTTTSEPAATYLASLDGGEPTRVTDGSRRMLWSSPEAGGQWLLGIEAGGLVAQAFDAATARTTGEPIVVTPGAFAASISDNGVLATTPTASGAVMRPAWFDRTGQVLGYVGDPGPIYAASLSPDGRSVVVQQPGVRPGEGGAGFMRTSTGGNRRLPNNQGSAVVWSPDGSQMIVSSYRDGRVNLFRVAADGSGGETRVFSSSGDVHANDWSRDGRWVIYTSRKDEGSELDLDLWVYPTDGRSDAKPAPYLTGSAREAQAEFSPDGRFVAYISTEIGAPGVYVQPFPDASGGKWLISPDGGVEPHWNPDGTELFYFSGQTLMAVPVRLQPAFSHGTPVRLFDAPVMPWYVNDSDRTQVTDRGQRFLLLVNSEKNVVPPLDVVVNWPSLLERRGR